MFKPKMIINCIVDFVDFFTWLITPVGVRGDAILQSRIAVVWSVLLIAMDVCRIFLSEYGFAVPLIMSVCHFVNLLVVRIGFYEEFTYSYFFLFIIFMFLQHLIYGNSKLCSEKEIIWSFVPAMVIPIFADLWSCIFIFASGIISIFLSFVMGSKDDIVSGRIIGFGFMMLYIAISCGLISVSYFIHHTKTCNKNDKRDAKDAEVVQVVVEQSVVDHQLALLCKTARMYSGRESFDDVIDMIRHISKVSSIGTSGIDFASIKYFNLRDFLQIAMDMVKIQYPSNEIILDIEDAVPITIVSNKYVLYEIIIGILKNTLKQCRCHSTTMKIIYRDARHYKSDYKSGWLRNSGIKNFIFIFSIDSELGLDGIRIFSGLENLIGILSGNINVVDGKTFELSMYLRVPHFGTHKAISGGKSSISSTALSRTTSLDAVADLENSPDYPFDLSYTKHESNGGSNKTLNNTVESAYGNCDGEINIEIAEVVDKVVDEDVDRNCVLILSSNKIEMKLISKILNMSGISKIETFDNKEDFMDAIILEYHNIDIIFMDNDKDISEDVRKYERDNNKGCVYICCIGDCGNPNPNINNYVDRPVRKQDIMDILLDLSLT